MVTEKFATEQDAWQHIANLIEENCFRQVMGRFRLIVNGDKASGLCHAIAILRGDEAISGDIADAMQGRIDQEARMRFQDATEYLWPCTEEGWQQRKVICQHWANTLQKRANILQKMQKND